MATYINVENVSADSGACLRVLAGLYQTSFVENVKERFGAMLAGAYSAYVIALDDSFDSALRAHLADVLQELMGRGAELTDDFEGELMSLYSAALSEFLGTEPATAQPCLNALDDKPELRQCIVRAVRSAETQHGGVGLAAANEFVKLLGQSVEGFRCPWTAANLVVAFGRVLEKLEIPVHARVEVALYRMFSQEVLRYLGDACLAFRDALPNDLAEINLVVPDRRSSGTSGSPSSRPGSNVTPIRAAVAHPKLAPAAADLSARSPCVPEPRRRSPLPPLALASTGTGKPGDESLLPIGAAVALMIVAVGTAAWLVHRDSGQLTRAVNGAVRPPLTQSAVVQGGREPAGPAAEVALVPTELIRDQMAPRQAGAAPAEPEAQPVETRQVVAAPIYLANGAEDKRALMRSVQLRNYTWTVRPGGTEMLFDLQIENTSASAVGGIEIVCSQFSANLDFIEAAKTILGDLVASGRSREFKAIPIGYSSPQTQRVNCVIADLEAETSDRRAPTTP